MVGQKREDRDHALERLLAWRSGVIALHQLRFEQRHLVDAVGHDRHAVLTEAPDDLVHPLRQGLRRRAPFALVANVGHVVFDRVADQIDGAERHGERSERTADQRDGPRRAHAELGEGHAIIAAGAACAWMDRAGGTTGSTRSLAARNAGMKT